jgi:hypothetical protein
MLILLFLASVYSSSIPFTPLSYSPNLTEGPSDEESQRLSLNSNAGISYGSINRFPIVYLRRRASLCPFDNDDIVTRRLRYDSIPDSLILAAFGSFAMNFFATDHITLTVQLIFYFGLVGIFLFYFEYIIISEL